MILEIDDDIGCNVHRVHAFSEWELAADSFYFITNLSKGSHTAAPVRKSRFLP